MELQMELGYVFSVVITGLTVVFLGLVLLVLFVWLLGKFFDAIKPKNKGTKSEEAKKVAMSKPTTTSPAPSVQNGIDDEVVAVIAAAVSAMSDGNTVYSIRSIKKSGKSSRRTAWGAAGVRQSTSQF